MGSNVALRSRRLRLSMGRAVQKSPPQTLIDGIRLAHTIGSLHSSEVQIQIPLLEDARACLSR